MNGTEKNNNENEDLCISSIIETILEKIFENNKKIISKKLVKSKSLKCLSNSLVG